MNLSNLPLCLIQHISDNYLHPIDKKSLKCVSKKFNRIKLKHKISLYNYAINRLKMDWDTSKFEKSLLDILNETNGVIAGSYILNIFQSWMNVIDDEKEFKNTCPYNDIDVFVNIKYLPLISNNFPNITDESSLYYQTDHSFKKNNKINCIKKVNEHHFSYTNHYKSIQFIFIDDSINSMTNYIFEDFDFDVCKCVLSSKYIKIKDFMACYNKDATFEINVILNEDYFDNDDNAKNEMIEYCNNIRNYHVPGPSTKRKYIGDYRINCPTHYVKKFKLFDPLNFYKRTLKYSNRGFSITTSPNCKIILNGKNLFLKN